MAKRFIDTDLFRKPLMRSLQGPYKALWIYLLCECDHAGVWDVELDVAAMRLGVKLDPAKVLDALGSAVLPIDDGRKWFLPEFVAFQYGTLNPANRVHASVLSTLSKYGIDPNSEAPYKPLTSPLQGAKDKEKDKEQDNSSGKERDGGKVIPLPFTTEAFALAWARWELHRKQKKNPITQETRTSQLSKCLEWGEIRSIAAINNSIEKGWVGLFEPEGKGASKNPATAIPLGARDIGTDWTVLDNPKTA